jgi:DNA-binding NtrC family response regulator
MMKLFAPLPGTPRHPFTPIPGSILLIDPDESLRRSRALLLSTLGFAVQSIASYADLCTIPVSSRFQLAVISLDPGESAVESIAVLVRHQWPHATILLLGSITGDFYDALYDEILDPSFAPSALLDVSSRLLASHGATPAVRQHLY